MNSFNKGLQLGYITPSHSLELENQSFVRLYPIPGFSELPHGSNDWSDLILILSRDSPRESWRNQKHALVELQGHWNRTSHQGDRRKGKGGANTKGGRAAPALPQTDVVATTASTSSSR